MSTSPSTIEHILSRVGDSLEVSARKMFGEYGLYLDGRMVAMVCDDTLFVKALPETIACLGDHEVRSPYPGAKPHAVVDERFMAGPGRLAELLRCAWAVTPVPKKKPKA
jgi:TfoX/Sxy family transcriptional regulator of competence genes